MIQKNLFIETPKENEVNEGNFDTNEELYNALQNLFRNRNGEPDSQKFEQREIKLLEEEKNMFNISDFFNYKNKKEIKRKLKDLLFLKKNIKFNNNKNVIYEEKDENNNNDEESEEEEERLK